MKIHEMYMDKHNRDARAKELRQQGYKVTRSSMRNQLLHPMYVEDYPRQLTAKECGFGNTIYQTHFAALYHVQVD